MFLFFLIFPIVESTLNVQLQWKYFMKKTTTSECYANSDSSNSLSLTDTLKTRDYGRKKIWDFFLLLPYFNEICPKNLNCMSSYFQNGLCSRWSWKIGHEQTCSIRIFILNKWKFSDFYQKIQIISLNWTGKKTKPETENHPAESMFHAHNSCNLLLIVPAAARLYKQIGDFQFSGQFPTVYDFQSNFTNTNEIQKSQHRKFTTR